MLDLGGKDLNSLRSNRGLFFRPTLRFSGRAEGLSFASGHRVARPRHAAQPQIDGPIFGSATVRAAVARQSASVWLMHAIDFIENVCCSLGGIEGLAWASIPQPEQKAHASSGRINK